jgi:EmrB/QacA subfamily drug resistance transporter
MSSSQQSSRWLVLTSISILIFLLNIDYTAVNLALVSISQQISGDLHTFQWMLSGYVLAWAALVVPAGRLADLYGKRTALIAGILLFMAGSLITGCFHSIEILILGRILQGVGAAIFSPACYGLIFTIMLPHQQGFGMGIFTAAAGFGLAAGPTLAGYILHYLSWRWIFYINIPLGIIVILSILFFVTKDKIEKGTPHLDPLAIVLLSAGLGGLMFALNQAQIWGWHDHRFWLILGLGLLSLVLFWFWDTRKDPHTLPRPLFRNKGLMCTIYALILNVYNFSLILVMMSLYLQNTLDYSTYETGLIFLGMTLTIGILSPIGGKITDLVDIRLVLVFSFTIIAVATFMMSFLNPQSGLLYITTVFVFAGLGIGNSWPALTTAMFRSVKSTEINTASGLYTMAMMIANSFSVIVATSLVSKLGQYKMSSLLAENEITLTPQQYHKVVQVISQVEHSPAQLQNIDSGQVPLLLDLINQAFLYGFSWNMWIGMVLALIALLPIYLGLKHIRHRDLKEEHIVAPI